MTKLHTDFIQKPWYQNYAMGLITIGMIASIFTVYDRANILAKIEAQQLVIDQYPSVLPPSSVQIPNATFAKEQNRLGQEIAVISEALTMPVGIILDDLQLALNRNIKLTQIDIALDKPIKVMGIAEDSRFLYEFIQQLSSNPSWQSVEMISETAQISHVDTQSDADIHKENNSAIQFELELMRVD